MEKDGRDPLTIEVARRCFSGEDGRGFYEEFERIYLDLPRRLFLEIAMHKGPKNPRRVLDVGCGTGSGLLYLRERLPSAEFVGIDPESSMATLARSRLDGASEILELGAEDLPLGAGTFDLIVSYSNLRLWAWPAKGLRRLADALAPGGLLYLLDLRGALEAELRAHLMAQIPDERMRQFFVAQLDAAVPPPQVERWIEEAALGVFHIGLGGLSGHPFYSSASMTLLQQNEHIAALCLRLSESGFRSPRAADAVFHLFVKQG